MAYFVAFNHGISIDVLASQCGANELNPYFSSCIEINPTTRAGLTCIRIQTTYDTIIRYTIHLTDDEYQMLYALEDFIHEVRKIKSDDLEEGWVYKNSVAYAHGEYPLERTLLDVYKELLKSITMWS